MLKDRLHRVKRTFIKLYKKYFTIEGGYDSILPDRPFLEQLYEMRVGRKPDFRHPKTFTEKCNWLKLHDRKAEYTMMVDKYAVREYIKKTIGEEYLVPLLGVWDNSNDIDFKSLPHQFVLKCNHNSNVFVCTDKEGFVVEDKAGEKYSNWDSVKNEIDISMKQNYYKKCREWPYKNIKRRIICEKYMQNTNGDELVDYKLFCFNGTPKLFMVNSNRFQEGGVKVDIYDMEWNHLNMQDGHYPFQGDVFEKPKAFNEIVNLSKKLSKGLPFIRVDFNIWNDKLYFSELTFYHSAGFETFQPDEWDIVLGNWLVLPK